MDNKVVKIAACIVGAGVGITLIVHGVKTAVEKHKLNKIREIENGTVIVDNDNKEEA